MSNIHKFAQDAAVQGNLVCSAHLGVIIGKETAFNVGDLGLIPVLERAPGERRGYPLQYSGLENYMDCIVHGVVKSRTRPSDFHFFSYPKPKTTNQVPPAIVYGM